MFAGCCQSGSRSTEPAARFFGPHASSRPLRPVKEDVVGDVGSVLWVLMGTIGIVLLIACANVANLLLVRAEGRQQELTIRAALGAGWGRIAHQLLVESVTLGVSGRRVRTGARLRRPPAARRHGSRESAPPGRNLDRSGGTGVHAGRVAVVGPSLRTDPGSRSTLGPMMSTALRGALHGGSRTLSQGRERHRSQNALVVAQVALAVVLLVAAGLMIRTFDALRNVRPGFAQPETVQMVRLSIPDAQVAEPERVVRMQQDIAESIAAIPGVTSVAFATALPLEMEFENNLVVTAEGQDLRARDSAPAALQVCFPRIVQDARDAAARRSGFHLDRHLRQPAGCRRLGEHGARDVGRAVRRARQAHSRRPGWPVERDHRRGRRRLRQRRPPEGSDHRVLASGRTTSPGRLRLRCLPAR